MTAPGTDFVAAITFLHRTPPLRNQYRLHDARKEKDEPAQLPFDKDDFTLLHDDVTTGLVQK